MIILAIGSIVSPLPLKIGLSVPVGNKFSVGDQVPGYTIVGSEGSVGSGISTSLKIYPCFGLWLHFARVKILQLTQNDENIYTCTQSPSIRIFQIGSNTLSIVELYSRRDSFLSVGVDLGGPIGLVLCVIIVPPLRGKFVQLEVFSVYGDPSLVRHNSVV